MLHLINYTKNILSIMMLSVLVFFSTIDRTQGTSCVDSYGCSGGDGRSVSQNAGAAHEEQQQREAYQRQQQLEAQRQADNNQRIRQQQESLRLQEQRAEELRESIRDNQDRVLIQRLNTIQSTCTTASSKSPSQLDSCMNEVLGLLNQLENNADDQQARQLYRQQRQQFEEIMRQSKMESDRKRNADQRLAMKQQLEQKNSFNYNEDDKDEAKADLDANKERSKPASNCVSAGLANAFNFGSKEEIYNLTNGCVETVDVVWCKTKVGASDCTFDSRKVLYSGQKVRVSKGMYIWAACSGAHGIKMSKRNSAICLSGQEAGAMSSGW